MSVDELLNPEGDYGKTGAWLRSRLRICVTVEITKRLGELGQTDLVRQCETSLKKHADLILELTGEPL